MSKTSEYVNPSAGYNEVSFFKTLLHLFKQSEECCIPAIVTDVHEDDGRVVVSPIVKYAKQVRNGFTYHDRPKYTVRMLRARHGGFIFDFPIAKGDTGWLIAGDRDWNTARKKNANEDVGENEGAQAPDTFGVRQFCYGFFIPDSWCAPNGEFKGKIILGNTQKDDEKRAYLTIDGEGKAVIHAGRTEIAIDGGGITANNRLLIKDGTSTVSIDPKKDLERDSAKFREVTVIVGKDESSTSDSTKFRVQRMRVLANDPKDCEIIEIKGGGGGGVAGTITYVYDIRYDSSSHQLQKRVATYDLATGANNIGNWAMIEGGQAEMETI